MKLYFNGCSHTVGICSDLHNIEETYPYKLSKELNAKFYNSALARSSNDRILRTTVEDMCLMEKLPDIAIIQWTYYDRFESPELRKDPVKTSDKWKDYRLRDLEWYQYNPYVSIARDKSNNSIIHQFNNYKSNAINSFLTKVLLLDSFLLSKSIRPIHMFFPSTRIIKNDYTESLYSECNKSNFLNSFYTGVEAYLDDEGYERAKDSHFKADGHTRITEWLKDFIINNKPISYKPLDEIHRYNHNEYLYPG